MMIYTIKLTSISILCFLEWNIDAQHNFSSKSCFLSPFKINLWPSLIISARTTTTTKRKEDLVSRVGYILLLFFFFDIIYNFQ